MAAVQQTIDQVKSLDVDQYKYGFETNIESDLAPKGLSEDIVRFISAKKGEPQWMLDWRLEAYRRWLTMVEPTWAMVSYPKIDFQDLYYYAAPKGTEGPKPARCCGCTPPRCRLTPPCWRSIALARCRRCSWN